MYKLKIENYTVTVDVSDGRGGSVKQPRPYNVKETIANLALHPNAKLDGYRLLKVNKTVEKIMESNGKFIELEDAEFAPLKKAIMEFQGLSRNEVELCKRLEEAEHYDVTKKEEKDKANK